MRKYAIALLALTCLVGNSAFAGIPGGPYVLFYDLERAPGKPVAGFISNYLRTGDEYTYCGRHAEGSITFLREHPVEFSESLIVEAVIAKNSDSIKKLQGLLRSYRSPSDEIKDGLDGVIVYVDTPYPEMLGLDTRSDHPKNARLSGPVSEGGAIRAYCSVFPNVYRR